MKTFEEGPTPWTDAHADELAYDEEEVNFDMIRRLERRCRAAEALAELEKLTRKLDECVWPEEHEEELIWWLSKGIDAAGAAWLTPRMLREAKRMETP